MQKQAQQGRPAAPVFCRGGFKEKCYCIRRERSVELNTQGFLPVAFVPVTFYNKSKDNSFGAFLMLVDTVDTKCKIYALLHDANIEITAEM